MRKVAIKPSAIINQYTGWPLIVAPSFAEKLEKDGFVRKIDPKDWTKGYIFTHKFSSKSNKTK